LLLHGALLLQHCGIDQRDLVSLVQPRQHLRDIVVADSQHRHARLEGAVRGDEDEPGVRLRVADRHRLIAAATHREGGSARARAT
jgi:hypothetical protein